jgi:hypothetical protein
MNGRVVGIYLLVKCRWLRSAKAVSSYDIGMAHFKFMLDRGVSHLLDTFPPKRAVSTESLGLRSNPKLQGKNAQAGKPH